MDALTQLWLGVRNRCRSLAAHIIHDTQLMFRRFIYSAGRRGFFSPHKFNSNPILPNVLSTSKPVRPFWTSSRLNQRYRYNRFNDPLPGSSDGSSPLQAFWSRLTSGQRLLLLGFGGGAPIFYVTHLETVEQTGRRRFIFMSRAMEDQLGQMVP